MLTRKSQYAVRALLFLAKQPEGGNAWLGVHQIAEKTGIPERWLSGIFLELRSAGLVASRLGKNGGYSLQQNPDQVTLLQILAVTDLANRKLSKDSDVEMASGFGKRDQTVDLIEPIMTDLHKARIQILDRTTLGAFDSKATALTFRRIQIPIESMG